MKEPQLARIPPQYELMQRLRPQSPIRAWMDGHSQSVETPPAQSLLEAIELPTCDGVDLAMGCHLLTYLPLTPVERAHANRLVLQAFKEPVTGATTLIQILKAVGSSFAVWVLVFIFLGYLTESFSIMYVAGIVFGTLLTIPLILGLQAQKEADKLRRFAAAALAQIGDPTCIVALYEQGQLPSGFHKETLSVLSAVLPRVTRAWYGQLPYGTLDAVTSLAEWPEEEMALKALEALEHIGDGDSVHVVKRLTTHPTSERIRTRAAAILPILIARRKQENLSDTLLRASSQDNVGDLVRPIYESEPDVSNLLRAVPPEPPVPPAS